MRYRIVCLLAAVLFLHAGAAQAGDVNGAKGFIDKVASQVLNILKTDNAIPEKQKKLETVFTDKIDTPFVGKFVLGGHWREATPVQQKDYLSSYGPFVIKNYAAKLTHYSGEQYKLTNARQDSDGSFLVTMEIMGGSASDAPIVVDYRLRSQDGSYKLADIVVEGVSLLATQRSEFNGIVQNKGLDYLIAQLKKSAEAKS